MSYFMSYGTYSRNRNTCARDGASSYMDNIVYRQFLVSRFTPFDIGRSAQSQIILIQSAIAPIVVDNNYFPICIPRA